MGGLTTTTYEPMFLHVDINSYFATVLQQENPKLRGRPVGVIKSEGRTCIIAASKEAKKLGVTTGCRKKDALVLAPSIVLVPADFELFFYCTKTLKELFESINPDAEIFSLDEAFIPLFNIKLMHPNPYILAEYIQNLIKEKLGDWVTCNVGIGQNRLLAKLAGEIAPKGSILEINDSNKMQILSTAKFRDVCGIGVGLEERLTNLGVTNPFDINSLDDDCLASNFGPFLAKSIRKIGLGEESYVLERAFNASYIKDSMKSVSRSITGYKLEDNEFVIKRVILNLIGEASFKLRKMGLAGRHIGIYLSGQGQSWSKGLTLKYYTRHADEIFNLIYKNLYGSWKRPFKIIKYAIWISLLEKVDEVQPTIFKEYYKKEKLYEAIDAITEKYGLNTLHPGIIESSNYIRPEVTGYLGDKKFLFNDR